MTIGSQRRIINGEIVLGIDRADCHRAAKAEGWIEQASRGEAGDDTVIVDDDDFAVRLEEGLLPRIITMPPRRRTAIIGKRLISGCIGIETKECQIRY